MQEDHQIERRKIDRAVKWERRFQSAGIALACAAIVWGVQTLANLDKSVAAITPRLDSIDLQVAGAYRASEARIAIASLQKQIEHGDARDADHDHQIEQLGSRVYMLERELPRSAQKRAKNEGRTQ